MSLFFYKSLILAGLAGSTFAAPVQRGLPFDPVKYVFGFGDSYTQTGYDPSLGILSADPLATQASGPTYLHFLTYNYNESDINQNSTRIPLFDFGMGRATVNNSIVPASRSGIHSLVDQVGIFNQYFSPAPQEASWSASDTLFTFWFGINDIQNSWRAQNGNGSVTYEAIATSYVNLLTNLTAAGATNFLVLAVPPFERSPQYSNRTAYSIEDVKTVDTLVIQYNSILQIHLYEFATANPSANVIFYDAHDSFSKLLDSCPNADSGFGSCNRVCSAYAPGRSFWNPYNNSTSCPAPLDRTFWVDGLHPTWAVHRLLADDIRTTVLD